nr:VOC family protein [Liquorilactobacillus satsumensis]
MEHLNWDHSMINVQSLDEAVQLFAKHGIIFQRGGKHQAWGALLTH